MGVIKKGKNWFIEYSTYAINEKGERERRRHQEKIGPSKSQAEAHLQKRIVERDERKRQGKKCYEDLPFFKFADRYLEYTKQNRKGYNRDPFSLMPLKKTFADTLLHNISPVQVEEYKLKRLDDVSPSTVNRELECLRAMLNKAMEWELIEKNPIKKMRLLREPPGRVRYLSIEEIQHLLDECSDRLRPFVLIALETGMRKGEIMVLEWKDVDLQEKIVHIEDSKTGERRDIPMSERLVMMFGELPKNGGGLFQEVKNFRAAFDGACKRAGIENFHFHDLRHTFASHLAIDGTGLLEIKELLGHKSLEMTMRYAHLCPDVKRKAIERLSQKMNHKPSPQ